MEHTFKTFHKQFNVDNVEVIRKRNTRFSPCNENYKEDDDLIRKRLIEKAGCTPVHWPADKDYKYRCKNKNEMIQVGTPLLETINPEFLSKKYLHCVSRNFISSTEGGIA